MDESKQRTWFINRLKRNKLIYEITISELKQEKFPVQLSYPESIEYNMNLTIPYRKNIIMLREVLRNIRKALKRYGFYAETSPEYFKRKRRLEEHLVKLRKIRADRKLTLLTGVKDGR